MLRAAGRNFLRSAALFAACDVAAASEVRLEPCLGRV